MSSRTTTAFGPPASKHQYGRRPGLMSGPRMDPTPAIAKKRSNTSGSASPDWGTFRCGVDHRSDADVLPSPSKRPAAHASASVRVHGISCTRPVRTNVRAMSRPRRLRDGNVDYVRRVGIRPWRILGRRVLLERPPWLTVGEQDVEFPDGTVLKDFSWIATRLFAIVVPLLDGDRTILARSFKLGVASVSLSLPALPGGRRRPARRREARAPRRDWARGGRVDLARPLRRRRQLRIRRDARLPREGRARSASRTAATTRSRSCWSCRSLRRSRSSAPARWRSSRRRRR